MNHQAGVLNPLSHTRLAVFLLISFALPNWAMNELNINLIPLEGDAEKFAVPLSIVATSKTIKGMIDDLGDLDTLSEKIRVHGIPVQVDARTLKTIAVCLENLKKLENEGKEQNSKNLIELIKNSFVEAETKNFSVVTETKSYSPFDSFISLANNYLFEAKTTPRALEDISVEDIIKFILAAHFLDIDKKLFPPAAEFLMGILKGTTLAKCLQAGKKLEDMLKEHNIPQELFVYFKDYISWFENSLKARDAWALNSFNSSEISRAASLSNQPIIEIIVGGDVVKEIFEPVFQNLPANAAQYKFLEQPIDTTLLNIIPDRRLYILYVIDYNNFMRNQESYDKIMPLLFDVKKKFSDYHFQLNIVVTNDSNVPSAMYKILDYCRDHEIILYMNNVFTVPKAFDGVTQMNKNELNELQMLKNNMYTWSNQ